ncbi:MAG: hypothetical protein GY853_01505 [PVC group bacterium]|nr:hypothetical protein [PVC group bacterium]
MNKKIEIYLINCFKQSKFDWKAFYFTPSLAMVSADDTKGVFLCFLIWSFFIGKVGKVKK